MLQLVSPPRDTDAFMLIHASICCNLHHETHVLIHVSTCVGSFKITLCDAPWRNQLAVISPMAKDGMINFRMLKKGQFEMYFSSVQLPHFPSFFLCLLVSLYVQAEKVIHVCAMEISLILHDSIL
jgi:hypothetical protein